MARLIGRIELVASDDEDGSTIYRALHFSGEKDFQSMLRSLEGEGVYAALPGPSARAGRTTA